MKTIGDALGHRDIESTFVYLRLDLEDLREAAQPPPTPISASPALPLVPACNLPPIRASRAHQHLPKSFQSLLAASLQRFLDIKRTLGRQYAGEAATLSHWDSFLKRQYPQARKVRAEMFYGWNRRTGASKPSRAPQSPARRQELSFVLRPRSCGHVYSGRPDFSEIHTGKTTPIGLRHRDGAPDPMRGPTSPFAH